MYTLHIANKNYSSWSLRPWVLLKELGIPFREMLTPFGGPANPDAFKGFSPTGRVPCLVDGDITVWDSLAITEYIGERQSGDPFFRFADLSRDGALIESANRAAAELIEADPAAARAHVERWLGSKRDLIHA